MPSKMFIDSDAIKKLSELLKECDLSEITYTEEERSVCVKRSLPEVAPVFHAPIAQAAPQASHGFGPLPSAADMAHPGTIKAPLVGTAYVSSEPGAAPFVKVGDEVKAGQTVLIIEAMKVLNPIKAPHSGKVTTIFIKDATPVEYGEPLMVIEEAI